MVQGDSYNLQLVIKNQGIPIDIDTVETVEIVLLNTRKTYPGKVMYEDGKFLFPLMQEETFCLPSICPIQVRVKLKGSDVIGSSIQTINVGTALSRSVL
nr:MAG TPA: hypothetical protein [Caudoviricetes sp.]